MSAPSFNLLTEPLLDAAPFGKQSLPGVLALLARDQVESFAALRPHQEAAWHMFLVQLAALALHRAGRFDLPVDEAAWRAALRELTLEYPNDEPWCLVVPDQTLPAFLQAPVSSEVSLSEQVPTPDTLDLLITARNHDLKQNIAAEAEAQDWVYSLVTLQTSQGYSGPKNYGIARMNGGSSSRSLLALAPAGNAEGKDIRYTPGSWFSRDVAVLVASREIQVQENQHLHFKPADGIALLWLERWPEQSQIRIQDLDIWFIEICRRVRLLQEKGIFLAHRGNSAKARIAADALKGAVGDPWAPVHKTENKSFTLGEGDFNYELLVKLLYSGDWSVPLLARPFRTENSGATSILIAAALARGNCKTWGYRVRSLPIGGKALRSLSIQDERDAVHRIALIQTSEIKDVDALLRDALALFASQGNLKTKLNKYYESAGEARSAFNRSVDAIFFEHLWARYEAQEHGDDVVVMAKRAFLRSLYACAEPIFEETLQELPCARIFRPRAEARSRRRFYGGLRSKFPDMFETGRREEKGDGTE